MLRKSRTARQNQSHVSVYLRSDAYYLARSVQTTTGLWTLAGETSTTVATDSPLDLGEALLTITRRPAEVIPHPNQDEWSRHRQRSLGPILSQARVRSWRAFEAGSTLVQVSRIGDEFQLTRMKRMPSRPDAWESDTTRELTLNAPDEVALGTAVHSLSR